MEMAQWGSNSPEIRQLFSSNQTLPKLIVKVLGILWDQSNDTLFLNPKVVTQTVYTKASFVSTFSKLYDPMGWFSPLLIPIKALLKSVWDLKLEWSDTLPEDMHSIINHYIKQLIKATEVYIPRKMFVLPFHSENVQLHIFVDASKIAYSAIAYFRLLHPHYNKAEVRIIMTKSRSSPKNASTIPRLELIAATIGARLIKFLKTHLDFDMPTYLWSDSKCVLTWILRRKILPAFVENRVQEIHSIPNVLYRYVPSEDNPADIGSRGSTFDELHNSIWWSGPTWLAQPPSTWPDTDLHLKDHTDETSSLDSTEPVFYTLKDTLHTYAKVPSTPFYERPLNDHAYIRSQRKTRAKQKQKEFLNPTLSPPYTPQPQPFHHEEIISTEISKSTPPYEHFILQPNLTPFNIDLNKFSQLLSAIGTLRRVLKW
ncbi:unnamed protein product, partial [Brugia timori]|uniref:Integrase catalytic domain-containing protein n=1 Tax=Brugia timori TaxID=42155 RepID=A0A0R3QCQ9_9BILA